MPNITHYWGHPFFPIVTLYVHKWLAQSRKLGEPALIFSHMESLITHIVHRQWTIISSYLVEAQRCFSVDPRPHPLRSSQQPLCALAERPWLGGSALLTTFFPPTAKGHSRHPPPLPVLGRPELIPLA